MNDSPYKYRWNAILPDGEAFCHWGGREVSERMVSFLDTQPNESVLDVCCGYGGTLSMMQGNLYGLDTDVHTLKNNVSSAALIQGDACNMPFQNESFDVVFAQDPDPMLGNSKEDFFQELARVLKPDGRALIQTYACTGPVPFFSTSLQAIGYSQSNPASVEEIKEFSQQVGLMGPLTSLHDCYASFTYLLALNAKKSKNKLLQKLFDVERTYFDTHLLTGVLLDARKK